MTAAGSLTQELLAQDEQALDDPFEREPQQALISPNSIYDPALKAFYDAEPKVRVFIQEPETWREPYPYFQRAQLNGITYLIVSAEEGVEVPESVAGVIRNKRTMDKLTDRLQALASAKARYTSIDQVPHHIR